jgi:hypothetical protein
MTRAVVVLLTCVASAIDFAGARKADRLALLLVVDVTASVNHSRLSTDYTFRDIVDAVTTRLQPGDTAAFALMTNHAHFSELNLAPAAFKTTAYAMLQASDQDRFGPSPLWDTLLDAVARVATMDGRRAIIAVTDGKSSGNVHGSAEIVPAAKAAGVAIHMVIENNQLALIGQTSPLDPATVLQTIARETGGLALADRPRLPRDKSEATRAGTIMEAISKAVGRRP